MATCSEPLTRKENIRLPVMDDAAGFMQGLGTVKELRAAAGRAPRTIRVDFVDGLPARR